MSEGSDLGIRLTGTTAFEFRFIHNNHNLKGGIQGGLSSIVSHILIFKSWVNLDLYIHTAYISANPAKFSELSDNRTLGQLPSTLLSNVGNRRQTRS